MKHIKKYNESEKFSNTLKELIGDIEETKKYKGKWSEHKIYITTKGCYTNIWNYDDIKDCQANIEKWDNNTGSISIKIPRDDRYYINYLYVYFENGVPKIISDFPGDERGCFLFGDVFIASGHDGNYLWNIKTGEYAANTW